MEVETNENQNMEADTLTNQTQSASLSSNSLQQDQQPKQQQEQEQQPQQQPTNGINAIATNTTVAASESNTSAPKTTPEIVETSPSNDKPTADSRNPVQTVGAQTARPITTTPPVVVNEDNNNKPPAVPQISPLQKKSEETNESSTGVESNNQEVATKMEKIITATSAAGTNGKQSQDEGGGGAGAGAVKEGGKFAPITLSSDSEDEKKQDKISEQDKEQPQQTPPPPPQQPDKQPEQKQDTSHNHSQDQQQNQQASQQVQHQQQQQPQIRQQQNDGKNTSASTVANNHGTTTVRSPLPNRAQPPRREGGYISPEARRMLTKNALSKFWAEKQRASAQAPAQAPAFAQHHHAPTAGAGAARYSNAQNHHHHNHYNSTNDHGYQVNQDMAYIMQRQHQKRQEMERQQRQLQHQQQLLLQQQQQQQQLRRRQLLYQQEQQRRQLEQQRQQLEQQRQRQIEQEQQRQRQIEQEQQRQLQIQRQVHRQQLHQQHQQPHHLPTWRNPETPPLLANTLEQQQQQQRYAQTKWNYDSSAHHHAGHDAATNAHQHQQQPRHHGARHHETQRGTNDNANNDGVLANASAHPKYYGVWTPKERMEMIREHGVLVYDKRTGRNKLKPPRWAYEFVYELVNLFSPLVQLPDGEIHRVVKQLACDDAYFLHSLELRVLMRRHRCLPSGDPTFRDLCQSFHQAFRENQPECSRQLHGEYRVPCFVCRACATKPEVIAPSAKQREEQEESVDTPVFFPLTRREVLEGIEKLRLHVLNCPGVSDLKKLVISKQRIDSRFLGTRSIGSFMDWYCDTSDLFINESVTEIQDFEDLVDDTCQDLSNVMEKTMLKSSAGLNSVVLDDLSMVAPREHDIREHPFGLFVLESFELVSLSGCQKLDLYKDYLADNETAILTEDDEKDVTTVHCLVQCNKCHGVGKDGKLDLSSVAKVRGSRQLVCDLLSKLYGHTMKCSKQDPRHKQKFELMYLAPESDAFREMSRALHGRCEAVVSFIQQRFGEKLHQGHEPQQDVELWSGLSNEEIQEELKTKGELECIDLMPTIKDNSKGKILEYWGFPRKGILYGKREHYRHRPRHAREKRVYNDAALYDHNNDDFYGNEKKNAKRSKILEYEVLPLLKNDPNRFADASIELLRNDD